MIGILGGMGTQAGLDFCSKLAKLNRGKADQKYPLFVLYNKSNIPDRKQNLKKYNKVLKSLIDGCKFLQKSKCKFISIPCNTAHYWYRDLRKKIKMLNVNLKLISDGDVTGALLVTDNKYDVDIFLGIGGGPEGVLAASALDAFNCKFQGRFLFKSDTEKKRANNMGIDDLDKKYELNEIIKGNSIFCATGVTKNELVNGVKLFDGKFVTETLVTQKNTVPYIAKKEIAIT